MLMAENKKFNTRVLDHLTQKTNNVFKSELARLSAVISSERAKLSSLFDELHINLKLTNHSFQSDDFKKRISELSKKIEELNLIAKNDRN